MKPRFLFFFYLKLWSAMYILCVYMHMYQARNQRGIWAGTNRWEVMGGDILYSAAFDFQSANLGITINYK